MISEYKTSVFLTAKAQDFADAGGYRLQVQSNAFTPIPTETYIKETLLANVNDKLAIGYDSATRQDPVYQLDVFTPKGQGGKFAGQLIGDDLMTEFNRGATIFDDGEQTIQITNASSRVMPANETHNWTMVQVDLTVLA